MNQSELETTIKSLMKAISADAPDSALKFLETLNKDAAPTEEMLRATKAGIMVNRLRANPNKIIGRAATDLVSKWKRMVEQEKAARVRKSKKVGSILSPRGSEGAGSPAAPTGAFMATAGREARPGMQVYVGDPEKRTFKTDGVDLKRTKSEVRDNVVGLMYNGLAYRSTEPVEVVLARAMHVEEAAYRHFDGVTPAYKEKMRSLMLNLKSKSNRELGRRVMSGDLAASRLVAMTPEELRSEEQRAQDVAIERENMKKAQVPEPMIPESDGRQCGKCKKRKVSLEQKQTRSADEPMTCIWTCLLCGHRWRAD